MFLNLTWQDKMASRNYMRDYFFLRKFMKSLDGLVLLKIFLIIPMSSNRVRTSFIYSQQDKIIFEEYMQWIDLKNLWYLSIKAWCVSAFDEKIIEHFIFQKDKTNSTLFTKKINFVWLLVFILSSYIVSEFFYFIFFDNLTYISSIKIYKK